MKFSKDVFQINAPAVVEEIAAAIRKQVHETLRRKGAVVGLSGGIDSSVCAGLCARAFGPEKTLAILMPELHSSGDSSRLGRMVAESQGIPVIVEDISSTLEAAGCYRRQLEAVRMVFPEYDVGWKNKIIIPSILEAERLNVSRLLVKSPSGEERVARLPLAAYLQLVAATNFKQRTRAMMAYYHADRLNYAVCGTPNLLEYDQGFFVKGGDGAADFKPIAHLYKTQVMALGKELGIPDEVLSRTPTTDTYSLPQTQEEFYFALPYDKMDLCLYGLNNNIPAAQVAEAAGLTSDQLERVYNDIAAKRRSTLPLHLPPLLPQPVPEISRAILAASGK